MTNSSTLAHDLAATGPETHADSVLDAAALARLVELDPKGQNHLLERVFQAFHTSAARLMPQLEAARVAGDRQGIRFVAHTLKSSSQSIGALRLSQCCVLVESMVRLEAVDGLDAAIADMGSAMAEALQAVDALPKGPP